MLPDPVSNPGPLTYESGALPIALRGPAQNAVILSKVIFLPAKSHMHIFNMLITSVQSFKLIA